MDITTGERLLVDSVRMHARIVDLSGTPTTRDWRYPSVWHLLAEHGRLFTASPAPADLGTPNECFLNAGYHVLDHHDVVYVEGVAIPGPLLGMGLDLPHAWYARGEYAIDPTPAWNDEPAIYLGVPFNRDHLRRLYRRAGVGSLLHSHTDITRDLLAEGLPDGAVTDIGRPLPPGTAAVESAA